MGQFEHAGRTFSRFHDLTATQGELFRACRRRPSSALPISDRAPLVWRAPASPEGQAAVPVGGGARPRYPQTTATPSPSKFRMQFPHDTNQRALKNRRISTIRFQYLKYTQGNCMRNCWMTEGPGCGARRRWQGLAGLRGDAPNQTTATGHHWCGGCRRVRRARAGFEIDHSERSSRVAISRAAGPDGARNTRGPTQQHTPTGGAPSGTPPVINTRSFNRG